MKTKNILSTFIFVFLFSITVSSCTKSSSDANAGGGSYGPGGTGANIVSIDMNGMAFSPLSVTVKIGVTVKWTNSDYYSPHTVTSDDGAAFNSGNLASGASYSFTPRVAGTFPYHCNVHTDMKGTLTVTN